MMFVMYTFPGTDIGFHFRVGKELEAPKRGEGGIEEDIFFWELHPSQY